MTTENPVRNVPEAGLTPMLPVTAEAGTVEMPLSARITKLAKEPRGTVAGLRARAEIYERIGSKYSM